MKQVTPLEKFTTDHLTNDRQSSVYEKLLAAAKKWPSERAEKPGLSFAVTGPVGIGKTTIALNLMRSAQTVYNVMAPDGTIEDTCIIPAGRLISATQLMGIMDPGRRIGSNGEPIGRGNLSQIFRGLEIIVVDDVGTEELAYVKSTDQTTVRQNRYGEFVDWCWRNNISIIITSMEPIMNIDGVRRGFIDIIGAKAFDRLWQMGSGYLFSLPGFPSYRRHANLMWNR